MGCQRVIQLSLGSLVGGTRCLWDPMMGNKGQESWNQLLCGYANIVPFWLERKDMKNEEKFAKDWRNWWTSSCISEQEYLNISKGDNFRNNQQIFPYSWPLF